MKGMIFFTALCLSMIAQAQSPDCSSVALAAVKGALKSTGSFEKRHFNQWNNATVIQSLPINTQAFDVTYSAGSINDDYVHYKVVVRIVNGTCDMVTDMNFLGEE